MKKSYVIKKRLLSIMLTFALVLGCVQRIGSVAKAAEGDIALELGKTLSVSVETGSETYLSFTPTEDGTYAFYSIGSEDTWVDVYDGDTQISYDDDSGENLNFCVYVEMVANTEYRFAVREISMNSAVFNVRLEKTVEPTSFEIKNVGESLTLYYGDQNIRYLEVTMEPANAYPGEVTWETSDEDVVTVNDNGEMWIAGLGSAVVTASAGDFSDSFTVNVVEPVKIENRETINVEMGANSDIWLGTFTPTVDGEYAFAVVGKKYSAEISDSSGNVIAYLSYSDEFSNVNLTAGETYSVMLRNDIEKDNTIEFTVSNDFSMKEIIAEEGKDEISISLFEEHFFLYSYLPMFATDEEVEWTVEDETIATVYGTYLIGTAPGKTKVTLSTESGLMDSFYVTVREPISWEGEKTETIMLSSTYPVKTFKFTVSETGYYELFSEGDYSPLITILSGEGGVINSAAQENENNFHCVHNFIAGEEYYLVLKEEDGYLTSCFDMTVCKSTDIDSGSEGFFPTTAGVEFKEDKMTVSMYDYFAPEYSFLPAGAYPEAISFSSSDTSVLECDMNRVSAVGIGTATITILSDSGFTDTIEIIVTEPTALRSETSQAVRLDDFYEVKTYSFTAPEDGTYVFGSRGDGTDPRVTVYDSDWNETDSYDDDFGLHFFFEYEMVKGETYYLQLGHYSKIDEFEVFVAKKVTPASMDFYISEDYYLKYENDIYYVACGRSICMNLLFDTLGALPTDVEYSTDGDVEFYYPVAFKMEKPGTANITLKSQGLVDTIKVVAIDVNVGDANIDGKLDINDVVMILQVADGSIKVSDTARVLCDYNADNSIDEKDAEELAEAIGIASDNLFEISTSVFNKVSYQAYLIEPWAMRATVRFTDADGATIDVSDMQDYGVYAIRAGLLDALANGEVTIQDIILDTDTIYFGKSDTEGEGMWATGDGRATFSFDDGLFTYRLSEDIYWVAYCVDADGNAHFTTYKTKSLSAIAETLVAASSTDAYIKAILEDMLVMEEAIVDYRSDFDNLTDLEPSEPNTVGNCGIDFGTAATDGKYAIGNSYRVSLIEPWSIRLIARIYDTTDSNTSSTDHIDYSIADDYGVIVFQDIDGTHGNMTSYEDLLALEDAYVYSKSQGNMEIDPDDSNRVSAAYDQNIFTYQLDKNIYCVSFVEIDGQFYYSKLLTRNLLSYMESQADAGTANIKLLTVFEAMVEMYESVKAYHESL